MKRFKLILLVSFAIAESLFAAYDFRDNGIGYTIIDSEKKEVKVTYYDSVRIAVPANVQFGGNSYTVVDAIYYDSTTCSLKHYDKVDFSKATNIALLRDQTTELIDIDTLVLPPNIHYFPSVRNITNRPDNLLPAESLFGLIKFQDTLEIGIHHVFSSGTTEIDDDGLTTHNPKIFQSLKYKPKYYEGVFALNTALEEVDISTHKIENVSSSAFSSSPLLRKCKLPNTVKCINHGAFFSCKSLESLNLHDLNDLKVIGLLAFYSTNLDSFYIGPKVAFTGYFESFYSLNLKKFVVNERNKHYRAIDGVLFDYDGLKLIAYPSAKEDESYTIPDGTEIIGNSAFGGCVNRKQYLKELTFASSINAIEFIPYDNIKKEIGGVALNPEDFGVYPTFEQFRDTVWYSFLLPGGVNPLAFALSEVSEFKNFENTLIETIPRRCFSYSQVEKIKLPATFKRADREAFAYYSHLKELDFTLCGNNVVSFGSSAFFMSDSLSTVDLSPFSKLEVVEPYDYAQLTSPELKTFIFPNNPDTTFAKQVLTRLFIRQFPPDGSGKKPNAVSTIYCPFEHPWDVMVDVPHYVSNGIGKPVDTLYTHEYTQHCLFYYVDRPNCTLVVPEESVAEFKSAPIWQEFRIRTAVGEVGIGKLHAYPSDPEAGTVLGGGSYPLFNNAYLQAFGKGDNMFEQWSDGNTENPRLYLVAKKSETLVAQFRPKKQYRLTVVANADTMGTVDGAGTYYETDMVRIIAQPYEGYRVESWSFAPYSRSQAYNFSMPSKDTTVVVNFGIDLTSLPLPADTAQQGDTTTLPINAGLNMHGATTPFSEPDAQVRVYGVGGQLLYVGRVKDIVLPRKTLVVVSIDGKAHKLLVP